MLEVERLRSKVNFSTSELLNHVTPRRDVASLLNFKLSNFPNG